MYKTLDKDLNLVVGDEAIKITIKSIILTNYRELIYNQALGIDYIGLLNSQNIIFFQKELQENLLAFKLIKEIKNIKLDVVDDKLTYTLDIVLVKEDKNIEISGEVFNND